MLSPSPYLCSRLIFRLIIIIRPNLKEKGLFRHVIIRLVSCVVPKGWLNKITGESNHVLPVFNHLTCCISNLSEIF